MRQCGQGGPQSVGFLEQEGYDMKAERAKLEAKARAYEEQRKTESARSEAAAEGAALFLGLLLLQGAASGSSDPVPVSEQIWGSTPTE